jgi:hypothetical protein
MGAPTGGIQPVGARRSGSEGHQKVAGTRGQIDAAGVQR